MYRFEPHLLHTWIITHKLVEFSERQPVAVCGVFKINLGFEQRVVDTYDPSQPQQTVVQDEVVVVDVIVLVSINEDHVKLLTCSSQFLEGSRELLENWPGAPQSVHLLTPEKIRGSVNPSLLSSCKAPNITHSNYNCKC